MLGYRVPNLKAIQSVPCHILKGEVSIRRIRYLSEMGLNSILTILIDELGTVKGKFCFSVRNMMPNPGRQEPVPLVNSVTHKAGDVSRSEHIIAPWLSIS